MSNKVSAGKEVSKLQRQLASKIARYIRTQSLPHGTKLTELGLAEIFKVSRTPVRAALELLAQLDVVETAQSRGFVVSKQALDFDEAFLEEGALEDDALYLRIASDFMADELGEQFSEADLMRRYGIGRGLLNRVLRRMALDLVIERNQGHGWRFLPTFKSPEAEDESYRFRLIIEPAAILEPGYAIDMVRAEASRRDHEAILAMSPDQVSQFQFFAVNAEFHELIAAGSHNEFIVQAVQQQNRLRRLLNLQWPNAEQRIIESCVEHMAMLTAIEQGDMEWAAALMRRHLEMASRPDLSDWPDMLHDGHGVTEPAN